MLIQLSDLIYHQAICRPEAIAVVHSKQTLNYISLQQGVEAVARGLIALGLQRGDRIAVYLPKRLETVLGIFGISRAGGVFVPVNPVLKAEQVRHIMQDCQVQILITSPERLTALAPILAYCPDLKTVVVVDSDQSLSVNYPTILSWSQLLSQSAPLPPRGIDHDLAAILYTSGSTGKPKGVVLNHRNLLVGAESVSSYLGNHPEDRLLAVLPLSFDAGLSQLTTAFFAGARVVLLDYLLPRDLLRVCAAEGITGITAVPPLWVQLASLEWPAAAQTSLRYIANTGGRMPQVTLAALRQRLPTTCPFLMYGLTEAFRSTYLPPEELDQRPDSIGKAIPNAEILVLRPDGTPCPPGETGELVHRGALVSQGYWNAPELTATRFRALPKPSGTLSFAEIAVWSGDLVRQDSDGFLYFVGRNDDMIKSSGYRISPTEVEEILYASGQIVEAVVVGVPHFRLGQALVAVVVPGDNPVPNKRLLHFCRQQLPSFMVPLHIHEQAHLPRNPNGKIDRRRLSQELATLFSQPDPNPP